MKTKGELADALGLADRAQATVEDAGVVLPDQAKVIGYAADALRDAVAEIKRLRAEVADLERYKAKLTRLSYDTFDDGRLLPS